jgi:hypothetical protein
MTGMQFAGTAMRNQWALSLCISYDNDPPPVKAWKKKPSFISKTYVPTSVSVK